MRVMGAFISQIYKIVDENPGITAGEIFENYQRTYPRTKRSRGEVAKRLTQLLERNLAEKGDTRVCEYSKFKVSTWKTLPLLYETLSCEPAEEISSCCCDSCSCCEEKEADKYQYSFSDIDDKAYYDDDEKYEAVDMDDVMFLRECRNALNRVDTNKMIKLIVSVVPGLSSKVNKLKRALRYF